MPTLPRQDRLRASGDGIDDSLEAGPQLQQQATMLGDLNAIRSQVRRLARAEHWYDAPRAAAVGGVQSRSNKRMPARITTADFQLACEIGVTGSPTPGSYVGVRINGIDVSDIGDGSKLGVSCYFSNDGATARAWGAIQQGDRLFWVGSVAGFELATSDLIDFIYEEGA